MRKAMRTFVDNHMKPEAQEKEASGEYISQELIDRMAEQNILAMRMGPGKHLDGRKLLGGAIAPKDYDYFADLILSQELVRMNARGFQDGNMAGMTISLSAVLAWANDEKLKNRVAEEVLSGKKKMSLAITEAFAGSDVAGLRTTAELSEDGSHYIVRGTKKWITNGMFSDYFVTGCKTKKGFSVLLVPKTEDVEVKLIKTAYSTAAATTFIEFNNVKVPKENLLGEEHKGFMVIMSNFNHERWMMACMVARKYLILASTPDRILTGIRVVTYRSRRVPEMGASKDSFRQTAHLTARHPTETGKNDRFSRIEPSLAGASDISNEPHVLQGAGEAPRRTYRLAEDLCHSQCSRDRRRGCEYVWRTRDYPVGHGKGRGAVP